MIERIKSILRIIKRKIIITPVKNVFTSPVGIPHDIYIETSTVCNMRCVYCIRTKKEFPSKNKFMSLEDFKLIINKVSLFLEPLRKKTTVRFFINGLGEPTLNPDFLNMILFLREKIPTSKILFVSNFNACDAEAYLKYIKAGADTIYISIDSLKQEVIEKSRCGANIAKMLNTLEEVCKTHSDKIVVISVLTEDCAREIKDIYAYIKHLGIRNWNIQLCLEHDVGFQIPVDGLAALRASLDIQPGMTVNFEGFPMPVCVQPFNTMIINVEGKVVPCCSNTTGVIENWGCIFTDSPNNIYFGEKATRFRELYNTGTPALCVTCPLKNCMK